MKPEDLWVWMDGTIGAARDARIGVLDHGFLYGDSIYETVRSHDGHIFGLKEHLDRLEASASAIRLTLPATRDEMARVLQEVVGAGPEGHDVGSRLIVTRGEGPLGIDPTPCVAPRLIVLAWPLAPGPHPRAANGVPIVITEVRRNPPAALDPHIKSGNFLNNILAYQEAQERGAFEGVLLTLEGAVAEGTTSNVFWVRDGEMRTASERGILLGVTRSQVLDIAAREGISHRVGAFPPEDLRSADEAFITSTLKGILPVASVDGEALPAGVPGPVTARIAGAYERLARER